MDKITLNNKNLINLRKSKRIFKNSLEHSICCKPEKIDLDTNKNHNNRKKIVTDELYFIDFYDFKLNLYISTGIFTLSSLLFFTLKDIKGINYFCSFLIFLGIFHIIYNLLKKNKKKFILDRLNGLFTYPDFFLKKNIVTAFNNSVVIVGGQGKYGALILKFRQTSFFTNYHLNNYAPYKFWSFMVWYMDKNRPLPPGAAFDPYRQKDFERRKAEGFPPPLYYSNSFITPEATPEQQAEREKYWKDRDYFAPPIKRPENSEIFNTNTHPNWSKCNFENGEHKLANTWYEFTFNDGKIIYMLTNENGVGYLPPENLNYKTASLTIKDRWF